MLTDGTGHCDLLCLIAILTALGLLTAGCSAQAPAVPSIDSFIAISDKPIFFDIDYNDNFVYPNSDDKETQQLWFGDQIKGKEGAFFYAKTKVPSGLDGTLEFVQDVKVDMNVLRKDGTSDPWGTFGNWYLDTETAYHKDAGQYLDITPSDFGDMDLSTFDSPHIDLAGSWKQVTLNEEFKMYIVWRPRGATDEQRIPIKVVKWSWKILAQNQSEIGSQWTLINSNQNPTAGGISIGVSTNERPILSPNVDSIFNDYPEP